MKVKDGVTLLVTDNDGNTWTVCELDGYDFSKSFACSDVIESLKDALQVAGLIKGVPAC